jgi:ADP-heptose:LPS heptosyltransferase
MGSILHSAPLLAGIRRLASRSRVLYLTFERNREMVRRIPGVTEVLTIRTGTPWRLVRDCLAVLASIRREAPDVVFDLEFFSKASSLVALLSGAPARVGYALPARWRRLVLTHAVPLAHGRHVRESFAMQLAPFGGSAPGEPAVLRPTAEDHAHLEKMFPRICGGAPIVAVNINAGEAAPERRWAPARFLAAARALSADLPETLFCFTGSAPERRYVEQALALDPVVAARSLNCAGLLTLGGLLALLERSIVFLTNDSGPMHLAGTLGTPTVALFGPESPTFYGPPGEVKVIYHGLPCSPCLNLYKAKITGCPYNAACMSAISVTEVIAAVREVLATRKVQVA